MKIYVDANNHCYAENIGGCVAVETPFFDGKCREFIEGYCYESNGDTTAIYPWKPYTDLETIQSAVDRTQDEADKELAALIEQIYLEDLEEIFDV